MEHYFNRFNSVDNYKKILFLSGTALQSAELNELQDIILNELKKISSYLVKSGTILSGAEAGVITSSTFQLNTGTIFVDGYTVEVPAQTIPITANDIELVGVAVAQSEVTANEDPDLREPDSESPNYGTPSAARLRSSGRWTVSTSINPGETFLPLFTLNNGVLVSSSASTDSESLKYKAFLEEYDRDTRGSYLISGLVVEYLKTNANSQYVFNVGSGKARVKGVDVGSNFVRTFVLDPVVDTREIKVEPIRFLAGTAIYKTRYNIVNEVISVMGTKQESNESVTHGAFAGATDQLSRTSVISITQVKAGSTVYVDGVDYQQLGDQIIWSWAGKTGNEPAPGSTYTVSYTYQDVFTATISADGMSVVLPGAQVSLLVPNSNIFVSYKHLLTRIDRINIDSTGKIVVQRGSASYTNTMPPPKNPTMLSLCTIKLSAKQAPIINSDTTMNITVAELNDLRLRIGRSEYNIAQLSLLENARSVDPTTNKKGVVVDPLYDDDMVDKGKPFTMVINYKNLFAKPKYQHSLVTTQGHILDYTLRDLTRQTSETSSRKINPYSTPQSPKFGQIELTPSAIAFERWWWTTTDGTLEPVVVTAKFTKFEPGEAIDIDPIPQFNLDAFSLIADTSGNITTSIEVPPGVREGSYQVRGVGRTSGSIATALVTLMANQQRVPTEVLRAQLGIIALEEAVSNINERLEDIENINAAQQGQINALAQQQRQQQQDIWSLQQTDANLQSQITTLANRPSVINNITNVTQIIQETVWWGGGTAVSADPIAQTFEYTDDVVIATIKIKVTELPADDLLIKIVPTRVGIPDRTSVIALGRIARADVRMGWNTVTFQFPIYLPAGQEYAFIVVTARPEGSIATAKLGLYDSTNNQWILNQPSMGVSLISANESTWTPVQDEDVTYIFESPVFHLAKQVTLFDINVNNISDWLVTAGVNEVQGTSVKFVLKVGDMEYDISNGIPLITQPITGNVKLIARLTTNNSKFSPALAPGLSFQYGTAQITAADPGLYHQRAFLVPQGSISPATIKVIINEFKPAGSTIEVSVLTTAPNTYTDLSVVDTTPIGMGFYETTYAISGVAVDQTALRIKCYTSNMGNRPVINNIRTLII